MKAFQGRRFALMAFALLVIAAAPPVFAQSGGSDFSAGIKRADAADSTGDYHGEESVLQQILPSAGSDRDRAEVNWRLARVYLNYGDAQHDAGAADDAVIALYQKGESFADLAITQNPDSAEGYFWKSGNVGKVGLLRGVLNSLFMIPTVKDLLSKTIARDQNHHDAFFALGQLYAKVPGWPISFGNMDQAVSLARRSIDLMESDLAAGKYPNPNYEFYTELANDLSQRNWDAAKRAREQAGKRAKYDSASDVLEKNLYYEGTLKIPQMSDRQEAKDILSRTIAKIQQLSSPTDKDLRVLRDARKALSGLN